MNGLMLHCGAHEVAKSDVYDAPTPDSDGSHFPIKHGDLLDRVGNLLVANDWNVTSEAHALSHQQNRYFGLMEVETGQPDFNMVVGIRNSHDKTFSASLAVGNRVFVCDNLSFSGDIVLARKHTRFVQRDLDKLVANAFGRLTESREKQIQRVESYKEAECSDAVAHDMVIRALDAQAITASALPRVLHEWREPSHEDFQPRNAWSLFNAFTEVYKQTRNVRLTHERSQRLHGLMDTRFAIAS